MTSEQRGRSARERVAAEPQTGRLSTVNDDMVRARAYELFEARGAQHGDDLEDWLRAERELGRTVDNRR